jgi:MoaA/NifB/PqqE/SkfB family radical SAM enzyme
MSRLRELGVSSLCLTGGEPLDHPHLEEIVNITANFQIRCNIITSALGPNRIERLRSIGPSFDHITVSADSSNVIKLAGVSRPLSHAFNIASSHKCASIHYVVYRLTELDLKSLIQCMSRGIQVSINPLILNSLRLNQYSISRSVYVAQLEADAALLFQQAKEPLGFRRSLARVANYSDSCGLQGSCGSRRLFISPNGDIRICPYSELRGNVLSMRRADTWNYLSALCGTANIPLALECSFICRDGQ